MALKAEIYYDLGRLQRQLHTNGISRKLQVPTRVLIYLRIITERSLLPGVLLAVGGKIHGCGSALRFLSGSRPGSAKNECGSATLKMVFYTVIQ
jgi:hypothetical protein